MFGPSPDDEVSDAALIRAARKRILGQLAGEKAAKQAAIVNNVYGGGGGGVMDQMAGRGAASPSPDGDDPYSYYVDITRKDLPDVNPHTGKPAGWEKSVHRYKQKRAEAEKKK